MKVKIKTELKMEPKTRSRIKTMKIGYHTVNNIVFGIMPTETDNLLGKNVLDKYKRWSVNKNLNELTLVRQV